MKKIKLTGILLVALAIGLSSCAKKKTDTSVINETPNVKIQDATEKSIEQTFELTATVQAQLKNSIAPSAPGRIREILVEF